MAPPSARNGPLSLSLPHIKGAGATHQPPAQPENRGVQCHTRASKSAGPSTASRRRRSGWRGRSGKIAVLPDLLPWPDDPAGAVAEWSRDKLLVPAGHPLAGSPLVLPDFGVEFLRDVFSHRESLMCIARKNAKSAIVAVLLLAHLVGPLRRAGWRAGVGSDQPLQGGRAGSADAEQITEASGLAGLKFYRTPAPGRVVGPCGGVDILSADRGAGHASGFDLAVIDEIGLLQESEIAGSWRACGPARRRRTAGS